MKIWTGCGINLSYNQLKQNAKRGYLPPAFAGIGALGALFGRASSIANFVIDQKDQKKKLEKKIRDTKAMEQFEERNVKVLKVTGIYKFD